MPGPWDPAPARVPAGAGRKQVPGPWDPAPARVSADTQTKQKGDGPELGARRARRAAPLAPALNRAKFFRGICVGHVILSKKLIGQ